MPKSDTEVQMSYARAAGLMYLLVLVGSLFGNFFVRDIVIDGQNAAATAMNIAHHETLFRVGIAVELTSFAAIVVLAVSLHTVLRPVSKRLALMALLWWVCEAAILGVVLFFSLSVLLLLGGDGYLAAFSMEQLQALALMSLKIFYYAYDIGLVFFGLGSVTFSLLFYRSRYIPRLLAGWGIFAGIAVLIGVFVMLVAPSTIPVLGLISVAPIFLYELSVGLWLLIIGINRTSP